ncbi:MAG: hypothetical protein ACKVPJ_03325 [Chitinophagales bacterium]
MVIDRRYKFIFVELPLTATSAISKEIREQYGCEPFLNKHATFDDFLKKANPEEKKYKSIGSVRNPIDQTVSMYFKYKNDLDDRFSSGRKRPGKWLRKSLAKNRDAERYQYIIKKNATFEQYFLKFFILPYSNWSIIHHKKMDFIIRFENLAEDYRKVFTELGLPVTRDLPQANKTPEKKKDFWGYYESDKAKRRAKFVFGPFMRYWGYTFPESWNHIQEPASAQILYTLLNIPRKIYWKYLR